MGIYFFNILTSVCDAVRVVDNVSNLSLTSLLVQSAILNDDGAAR